MDILSASTSPAQPGSRGLWQWLLRSSRLAAWFRQTPTAAHAGYEERAFLQLALSPTASRPGATLLAEALVACQPALRASSGAVVSQQATQVLLSWPIVPSGPPAPVVAFYFQLRDAVRQLAATPTPALYGAASLGWVKPRWTGAGWHYRGKVLGSVAGILREGQRLSSDLLISAALHQQLNLGPAYACELHVAFEVAGHRYPATLYRVAAT